MLAAIGESTLSAVMMLAVLGESILAHLNVKSP